MGLTRGERTLFNRRVPHAQANAKLLVAESESHPVFGTLLHDYGERERYTYVYMYIDR